MKYKILMKIFTDLPTIAHLRLEQNFGYDDDYVIESLHKNMEELRKAKLLVPDSPPENELPQNPFGMSPLSYV